jgi:hypothetical protein
LDCIRRKKKYICVWHFVSLFLWENSISKIIRRHHFVRRKKITMPQDHLALFEGLGILEDDDSDGSMLPFFNMKNYISKKQRKEIHDKAIAEEAERQMKKKQRKAEREEKRRRKQERKQAAEKERIRQEQEEEEQRRHLEEMQQIAEAEKRRDEGVDPVPVLSSAPYDVEHVELDDEDEEEEEEVTPKDPKHGRRDVRYGESKYTESQHSLRSNRSHHSRAVSDRNSHHRQQHQHSAHGERHQNQVRNESRRRKKSDWRSNYGENEDEEEGNSEDSDDQEEEEEEYSDRSRYSSKRGDRKKQDKDEKLLNNIRHLMKTQTEHILTHVEKNFVPIKSHEQATTEHIQDDADKLYNHLEKLHQEEADDFEEDCMDTCKGVARMIYKVASGLGYLKQDRDEFEKVLDKLLHNKRAKKAFQSLYFAYDGNPILSDPWFGLFMQFMFMFLVPKLQAEGKEVFNAVHNKMQQARDQRRGDAGDRNRRQKQAHVQAPREEWANRGGYHRRDRPKDQPFVSNPSPMPTQQQPPPPPHTQHEHAREARLRQFATKSASSPQPIQSNLSIPSSTPVEKLENGGNTPGTQHPESAIRGVFQCSTAEHTGVPTKTGNEGNGNGNGDEYGEMREFYIRPPKNNISSISNDTIEQAVDMVAPAVEYMAGKRQREKRKEQREATPLPRPTV